jgi:hypothetical protein
VARKSGVISRETIVSDTKLTQGKNASLSMPADREPFVRSAIEQPDGRQGYPVTPRNWWRLQAGRFKDDPTFSEFVALVRAARSQERQ